MIFQWRNVYMYVYITHDLLFYCVYSVWKAILDNFHFNHGLYDPRSQAGLCIKYSSISGGDMCCVCSTLIIAAALIAGCHSTHVISQIAALLYIHERESQLSTQQAQEIISEHMSRCTSGLVCLLTWLIVAAKMKSVTFFLECMIVFVYRGVAQVHWRTSPWKSIICLSQIS